MTPEQRRLLDRMRREQTAAEARLSTPAQRIARMDELFCFSRTLRPGDRGASDEPPALLLALRRRRLARHG